MKSIFNEFVDKEFLFEVKKQGYDIGLEKAFYECFRVLSKNVIFENSFKTVGYLWNEQMELLKESGMDISQTIISKIYCSIMNRFPILKGKIEQMIQKQYAYIMEVQKNYYKDIKILKKEFGIKGKCIKLVDMNSDKHQGGKSVLCLIFESGSIIYKPKSLKSDIIWNKIIDWQNTKKDIERLRGIKTIDRYTYGWQERIEFVPENTEVNIRTIYERMGILLCMSYLCGMTDIHMDNIIINKNMPYVIDTETLFNYEKVSEKELHKWILQSVLSTQMLPVLYGTEEGTYDLSGITGGSTEIKIRKQVIKELQKHSVKIVWEEETKKDIKNIPQKNSRYIEPRNYIEDIIEGFQKEYILILKYKIEFEKLFENRIVQSYRARFIYRDTNKYQSLLLLLRNPKYLIRKNDREKLLEMLKLDEKIPKVIVEKEIESLENGDVPYFTIDYNNRVFCEDEYLYTDEQRWDICQRIANCSRRDLQKQVSFIRMGMALPEKNEVKERVYKKMLPDRKIYQEIYKIASQLEKNAFLECKDNTVEWINIVNAYPNWGISEQGLDLYFGLPGNVIFFASLYKTTQSQEYLSYLEMTLNSIEIKRKNMKYKDFSLFSGKMSLIYMYALLTRLFGGKYNQNLVEICEEILEEMNVEEVGNDITNGISGILIGFCCVYKVLREERYYAVIDKLTTMLIERINSHTSKEIFDVGIAHGYGGILIALSRAYVILGKKECIDTIFLISKKFFLDIKNADISWCHGLVGIGLSYISLNKILGDEIFEEKLKECELGIRNRIYENSDCLCHGNMGIVDFYIEYSKYKNTTNYMKYAKSIISYCVLQHKKWYCGCKQDIVVYGIMTGISGMGYEMLRFLYPNELPSILLLEI